MDEIVRGLDGRALFDEEPELQVRQRGARVDLRGEAAVKTVRLAGARQK